MGINWKQAWAIETLLPTIVLSLLPVSTLAQTNYVAFELARDNNWSSLVTEDMDGDGGEDIIVSHYQAGVGRELHIFHQRADGSFSSTPQRIEIKTDIIAVGFADLRPEPGKELLLFANNGVFSLSSTKEGYAGNIKQLVDWELIAAVPDLEQVQFIDVIGDINNDGLVDLLLPGDDIYGYFRGIGQEKFELVSTFSTINEKLPPAQVGRDQAELDVNISISAEQGVMVNLNLQAASPYSGFVEEWSEQAYNRQTLMRTEHWMPTAILANLNEDELLDIIYLNVGEDRLGQLNIHYQNSQTGFNDKPDWFGSINTGGDLQLVDMNQDQRLDLLRLDGNGNDFDARFYLNQDGRFNLDQPSQIMRFSGYDVRLSFISVHPESGPVLNVSYYTIPVVDVIRNASINRTQLLYGSDNIEPGQLFNRRPDSSLVESFSATNVRGLSEQMSLQYDIDGDGSKDALYITENGTLAAKKIDSDLNIADQPFWEYVSSRSVFEFEVLRLNMDDNPDLMLRHGTTTTMLVASP